MVGLVDDRRNELAELCRRFGVERMELFGSATDHRFDPDHSDVDLIVDLGRTPVEGRAARYFGLLDALEELFGRPVDLVEASAIRNPYFRRAVDRQRELLYAA